MYLPHLETIDPRFTGLVLANSHLEMLWSGGRWLEGPAWFGGARYLLFSDIPNDRILRLDETDGSVSEFRRPSNNANGNSRDAQGRLLTCEHHGRRVTRTEHDGSLTVLSDNWQGKRLNSPNDVVVAADGAVWFTDPTYGIDSDYEGAMAESEIGASHLYRIDPATGTTKAMATDFVQPNGLAFSPDGCVLYVADTGATHVKDGPRHIRRFAVTARGLSGGEVLSDCDTGLYDGFRVDREGRIWTSAGDGVHCLTPEGALLGKILVPEVVANVCFGGLRRNRLFICATTCLYATFLNTAGTPYP